MQLYRITRRKSMTRLIVDASLPDKLPHLLQPVELCDATGRVIGHFVPQLDPTQYNLEPQISEAELDRREQEEESYTTAEVLAYLENL
jgi:hypothetical protein